MSIFLPLPPLSSKKERKKKKERERKKMNKQEIYELLRKKKIPFEITEHEAVYNMEQLAKINVPYPDRDAKNLFVRDDKKKNYYLISVKADVRVDLKGFRKKNGTRPLTFASEDDLQKMTSLSPGSVSPLGLLNDVERKIIFFIDKSFIAGNGIIGVHPNENTATIWLKTKDLLDLISEHGNQINIFSAENEND